MSLLQYNTLKFNPTLYFSPGSVGANDSIKLYQQTPLEHQKRKETIRWLSPLEINDNRQTYCDLNLLLCSLPAASNWAMSSEWLILHLELLYVISSANQNTYTYTYTYEWELSINHQFCYCEFVLWLFGSGADMGAPCTHLLTAYLITPDNSSPGNNRELPIRALL